MQILSEIYKAAASRQIQFIVIGGHAIGASGYVRATGDIDLMIRNRDRDIWKTLLSKFGYVPYNEQEAFIQLDAEKTKSWPIDLMCSSDQTFDGVLAASAMAKFGEVNLPIPSVKHLIAMKLHALKSRTREAQAKDVSDIVELLKIAGLAPDSDEFRQLCIKFSTIEVYEGFAKIKK